VCRGSDGGPGSKDPGRYSYDVATPLDLIAVAYHVDYFQISSKAPLDQQRFDLAAKVPEGATKEQFREMMRNLLAERFHLKVHMESREFPAYELVVAKSGLKLKESGEGGAAEAQQQSREEGFPVLPAGRPGIASTRSLSGGYELVRMRARQEPLSVLAEMIVVSTDRKVVNRTGLSGKYDFTFEYSIELPGGAPGQPPAVSDLLDALPQQLGLQLVAKQVPFDVVVVESMDGTPTEN